jgi:hypothetical protein
MLKKYSSPTGIMDEDPDYGDHIDRDELIAALKFAKFRVDYRYESGKVITKKDLLEALGIDKKELE